VASFDGKQVEPDRVPGAHRCLTILLVEDQVLIRFAGADALRGAGHEVVEAANAEEALSLLNCGLQFDLMVSDIKMPGSLDGAALANRVRHDWPRIAVLLAAAEWPDGTVSGTNFLQKPYTDRALLEAVQEAVGFDRSGRIG